MKKGYTVAIIALLILGVYFIADGASAYATSGGGGGGNTTTTTTTSGGVTYTTATTSTNVCNTCGTSGLQVLPLTGSYSSYAGAPFYFSVSASGGSPAYWYTWTFGDGSTSGPTSGPSGASVSHVYTTAGSYQATVQVKDSAGAIATGSYAVNVLSPPSSGSILVVFDFVQQGPYTNPGTYPIPNAVATLSGYAPVSSNAGGQAAFNIQPGTVTLTVTASGYKTYTQTYTFTKNTVVPAITLTPSCFPACGLSSLDFATGLNVSPLAEIVLGVIALIVTVPVAYVGKDD